jgi:hypothetical protein
VQADLAVEQPRERRADVLRARQGVDAAVVGEVVAQLELARLVVDQQPALARMEEVYS